MSQWESKTCRSLTIYFKKSTTNTIVWKDLDPDPELLHLTKTDQKSSDLDPDQDEDMTHHRDHDDPDLEIRHLCRTDQKSFDLDLDPEQEERKEDNDQGQGREEEEERRHP